MRSIRLVLVVATLTGAVLGAGSRGRAGIHAGAAQPQAAPHKSTRTQIVFLGTGTPIADPERSGPALAIVVNDIPYLVDFGPGVVRRAVAADRAGVKGLALPNLRRVFATHLHSDHTVGYPDLIFTTWVMGRVTPLEVYGPRGLKAMTAHILRAYREDIDIRVHGLEGANKAGARVHAHEIRPGIIYRDEQVTVKAFLVQHGSWPQAFGYRFETPDRTIVISGDCRPSASVVENCQGCDVLIHEVYSRAGYLKRTPAWQNYHAQFHTSSRELARIATQARPKLLILYHQLFWDETEASLLEEIRQGYAGQVVSAHDLEVY